MASHFNPFHVFLQQATVFAHVPSSWWFQPSSQRCTCSYLLQPLDLQTVLRRLSCGWLGALAPLRSQTSLRAHARSLACSRAGANIRAPSPNRRRSPHEGEVLGILRDHLPELLAAQLDELRLDPGFGCRACGFWETCGPTKRYTKRYETVVASPVDHEDHEGFGKGLETARRQHIQLVSLTESPQ